MNRAPQTIRIKTGARLHFGLLDCLPPFGGLGVMIDAPATTIQLTQSDQTTIDPRISSIGFEARTRAIMARAAKHFGLPRPIPVNVSLLEYPPTHSGFGSGTQYSLAFAESYCRLISSNPIDKETLVIDIAARARRSAVGAHGYFVGGLIFETNQESSEQTADNRLNAIAGRVETPPDWCVLLIRPNQTPPPVAGDKEQTQFDKLDRDPKRTERLKQIAIKEVMPAAERGDFESFANSIESYNYESGLLFEAVQGGPYNGEAVATIVDRLKHQGTSGAGQSSWGPTVFAWCENRERADRLRESFSPNDFTTLVSSINPQGRVLQSVAHDSVNSHTLAGH
ncbi:hypothetical protein [Rhodopirellula sp. MGV]|uniref:hypothetical protein n=1 Tax=Rhodopirellula sp. MGV TaxID=2023130 RepID=UPI000B9711D8|nr:hypothetical protein [Rhodopirellula sp. MGV]OYP35519.1 hypothetical protein CGZ80_11810 [Rhodopirellula sp. MGV]PNY34482.1 beta-ribofuranosylaminobenzene 5'-phosphate synthase [Rhodopirellula baltica]